MQQTHRNKLWYALFKALMVFVITLLLHFASVSFAPVASVFAKMRNASLDTLMNVTDKFNSHKLDQAISEIWFIGIDDYYEKNRLSDDTNGIDMGIERTRLAKVISQLELLEPRAIFLDFALSETVNEDDQLSSGDLELLNALKIDEARDFAILVPSRQIANVDISNSPSVCPVSSDLYLDFDGVVRRIAFSANNSKVNESNKLIDYGAVYYLERLAYGDGHPDLNGWKWQNCQEMRSSLNRGFEKTEELSRQEVFQELRNRTIFRQWNWRRGQPNDSNVSGYGISKWSGGLYLSAQHILDDLDGLLNDPNLDPTNKIFILGHSNPEDRSSRDIYTTPVGTKTGAEIHYHSLMTILHNKKISFYSLWVLLSYLAMFFIIFGISYFFLNLDNLFEFTVMGILVSIPAFLLYNYLGIYMDYVIPLFVVELFSPFLVGFFFKKRG